MNSETPFYTNYISISIFIYLVLFYVLVVW